MYRVSCMNVIAYDRYILLCSGQSTINRLPFGYSSFRHRLFNFICPISKHDHVNFIVGYGRQTIPIFFSFHFQSTSSVLRLLSLPSSALEKYNTFSVPSEFLLSYRPFRCQKPFNIRHYIIRKPGMFHIHCHKSSRNPFLSYTKYDCICGWNLVYMRLFIFLLRRIRYKFSISLPSLITLGLEYNQNRFLITPNQSEMFANWISCHLGGRSSNIVSIFPPCFDQSSKSDKRVANNSMLV